MILHIDCWRRADRTPRQPRGARRSSGRPPLDPLAVPDGQAADRRSTHWRKTRQKLSFNTNTWLLNETEFEIIKEQIRKNSRVMDSYVERIDLFVNLEKYPKKESFIQRLRQRLFLLMEENDTFREVLWRHYQAEEALVSSSAGV